MTSTKTSVRGFWIWRAWPRSSWAKGREDDEGRHPHQGDPERRLQPIVFCRFIHTRNTLQGASRPTRKECYVGCVTGLLSPEEREARVNEMEKAEPASRVLVCTDCLSEGINMQSLLMPWSIMTSPITRPARNSATGGWTGMVKEQEGALAHLLRHRQSDRRHRPGGAHQEASQDPQFARHFGSDPRELGANRGCDF